MKPTYRIVIALAAGAALGAAAIQGLQAQAKPPAYVIAAHNEIMDEAALKTFTERATPVVASQGGRFIIRSANPAQLTGEAPKRFAVIQFENPEKARSWYGSAEMKPLNEIRDKAMKVRIFLVDGVSN